MRFAGSSRSVRSFWVGQDGATAKHDYGYLPRLRQQNFHFQPEHRGRHDVEAGEGLHREPHEG